MLRPLRYAVAAFYAYGGLVHVLNMLSLSGFDWMQAPFKWQALDVAYLILNAIVVVGLVRGYRFGFIAFYAAALSQLLLYTLLRDWILDVPAAFAPSPDEVGYLDTLVIFHLITLALMSTALWIESRRQAST